jgi:hypothetical protein
MPVKSKIYGTDDHGQKNNGTSPGCLTVIPAALPTLGWQGGPGREKLRNGDVPVWNQTPAGKSRPWFGWWPDLNDS